MKLSIIIPVFNEEKTIVAVIKKVAEIEIPGTKTEIIVVDDGSTDGTVARVKSQALGVKNLKLVQHEVNKGKGSAVRTGIDNSIGDYIIIQDADLEYNPSDIPRLYSEVKNKKDVIYGTRLNRLPHLNREERRFQFLTHYFGNRFLSLLTSLLYGQWVTDMETCYKLFPRDAVKNIKLRAKRFDFEPEITAKLLKRGLKIKEIPISTTPRGYEEGKKLNTIRDGIAALWTLLEYRVID